MLADKAVDSIFKKPSSVFVTAKAKEILFEGLPVDCTVKDFAGSATCNVLKEKAESLVPVGEGKYLFSLFGHVRTCIMYLNIVGFKFATHLFT